MTFKEKINQGIPKELPAPKSIDSKLNPAPKRKQILNVEEKKLAIKNALRYFPKKWHKELALDFAQELDIMVEYICFVLNQITLFMHVL